jgi:superoxide dismutase, Fe-Mn family
MKKREFLKTAGILGAGIIVSPMIACSPKDLGPAAASNPSYSKEPLPGIGLEPFLLPALGYETSALEPAIDAQTMQIHHDKHHAAYVEKLNAALNGAPFKGKATVLEDICALVTAEDTAIRNNGGGHWNHSMFWKWIKPGGASQPSEALAAAITRDFGNMDEWKKQFSEAAKNRFGSGWAWLSVGPDKRLFVSSTSNQDNPLMKNLVDKPGTPILGLDVWEHAYYLNYQNRRPDYITAVMNIVNWDEVNGRFDAAMKA